MKSSPLLLLAALAATALLSGCRSSAPTTVAQNPASPTAPVTTPVATATPSAPILGYIRALHAVPGMGPLSLIADGQKFDAIKYGAASTFAAVRAPKVALSVYGSDGKKVAGPVPLELKEKRDVTILIAGVPGDTVLIPWNHKDNGPEKAVAKIAFVHSAKALPPLDIALDGKTFRRNVKFGVATDPTTLSPGRHRITVTYDKLLAPAQVEVQGKTGVTKDGAGKTLSVAQPTPIKALIAHHQMVSLALDVDLLANRVYSLAIFPDGAQQPQVRLMEDQFAATKNQP